MRYAYYPGCSLESTGVEYNMSAKAVAKHLGIELWEIPDWICCGASAAHSTDHLLGLALPAYHLAVAEKENLDVAVPCAACYNRMRASQHAVRTSPELKEKICRAIEMEYNGTNEAVALLDLMANRVGTGEIKKHVTRPLTGLKVASYYGCLLVRPRETTGFDDPENP
ncbi:MAG TPA: heterodisulfide reductase subunit B, partial [Clostridia bacterium]|nr:heterodisulfide reductase subunit B [Clostridia bacterium]